jgi:riboflavin synthase
MFTGIIEEVGEIKKVQKVSGGTRVQIISSLNIQNGDSISVDGVCLTAEEVGNGLFTVFMSSETLARSHFSRTLREGLKVNLERALTPSSFMGGHIVLGHVDCTGEIYSKEVSSESGIFIFRVHDPSYMKYLVEKGSVAVNGISLTCFDIKEKTFKVAVIPYTLNHTTLGILREGDPVNLEFDIIAKYTEKLLTGRGKW